MLIGWPIRSGLSLMKPDFPVTKGMRGPGKEKREELSQRSKSSDYLLFCGSVPPWKRESLLFGVNIPNESSLAHIDQ